MEIIVFNTLKVRDCKYIGFLKTPDITNKPLLFFVMIRDYIVGTLIQKEHWIFKQSKSYSVLPVLDDDEIKKIEMYLGNVVEEHLATSN